MKVQIDEESADTLSATELGSEVQSALARAFDGARQARAQAVANHARVQDVLVRAADEFAKAETVGVSDSGLFQVTRTDASGVSVSVNRGVRRNVPDIPLAADLETALEAVNRNRRSVATETYRATMPTMPNLDRLRRRRR